MFALAWFHEWKFKQSSYAFEYTEIGRKNWRYGSNFFTPRDVKFLKVHDAW